MFVLCLFGSCNTWEKKDDTAQTGYDNVFVLKETCTKKEGRGYICTDLRCLVYSQMQDLIPPVGYVWPRLCKAK